MTTVELRRWPWRADEKITVELGDGDPADYQGVTVTYQGEEIGRIGWTMGQREHPISKRSRIVTRGKRRKFWWAADTPGALNRSRLIESRAEAIRRLLGTR